MTNTLKQIGEFGLIERISKGCLVKPERVMRGIGDDAAAVTVTGTELLLLTTDLLVEGVHFLRSAISGFDLGYKALAVNLSDIAAMGGAAREVLASIAVSREYDLHFIEELYQGMKMLAAKYSVNIIGGDTTRAQSGLVISITATGEVIKAKMLCRNGAKVGDIICLTGYPGESAAGLHLLLNRIDDNSDAFDDLRRQHRRPRPHLPEGRWLSNAGGVHAAIDISDGLGSDLAHVIRQSGVGARIDADRLPVSRALATFCRHFEGRPLDYLLDGGEDYILLCTIAPEKIAALTRRFEAAFGHPLHQIGEIITGDGIELKDKDGKCRPISPKGWNHFRRESTCGKYQA